MNRPSFISKILFATWLTGVSLIALLIAFTMGAAVLRHITLGGERVPKYIQLIIVNLAALPSLVKQASVEILQNINNKPTALLIPKGKAFQASSVHKFPAPEDDGYLLLSGISALENASIVQLIRIADGFVLAKWTPDWNDIHRQITGHRFGTKGNSKTYRAIHPLLLKDASIIFNTGNSLVRLQLCNSKPTWVLDYPYHHSIELSPEGSSVWVPSVTEVFASENVFLKDKLRDDSLAEVSLDGKVLQNISFSKILSENNLTSHMLGSTGETLNIDPLHINQITPANTHGKYWQRGDLLISARHTSTVYLYRPKTGKIIWFKQGDWLNQHSAHFSNDNAISIFGNDVYGSKLSFPFIYKESHNQIYHYDLGNSQIRKLNSGAMSLVKPMTVTEGRVRVLDDMSIFVEETNNSRLFKLSASGQLIWSYINTYDNEHLGAVSWSRYLTRDELHSTVNNEQFKCGKID